MKTTNGHKYSFQLAKIDPDPCVELGNSIEDSSLVQVFLKTDAAGIYPFIRLRYAKAHNLFSIKTFSLYVCLQ